MKSEITKILALGNSKIVALNADQNLAIYEIAKKVNKKGHAKPTLKEVVTKCFYLDEIIDIKGINKDEETGEPTKALLCSNNETLKIMDLKTGAAK